MKAERKKKKKMFIADHLCASTGEKVHNCLFVFLLAVSDTSLHCNSSIKEMPYIYIYIYIYINKRVCLMQVVHRSQ